MEEKGEMDIRIKIAILGIIAFFTLMLICLTAYTIGAGERGVLLTFGKPSMDAVGEGLHFKIPFAQSIKKLEVKTQKIETDADSVSKDLQGIYTTIALNFHLMPDSTPSLYQEIGTSYKDRIIDPAIQESVKAVTAKYKAEELIENRAQVSREIKEALEKRLEKYYIKVDDFNIVNFKWSDDFNKAIEDKQVAEQRVITEKRNLERIKVEAEQKVAQAQAEAEALRLQKQEITPDLIKLRSIEVKAKAIEKWDGILPQVTGGAIPFISLNSGDEEIEEETV